MRRFFIWFERRFADEEIIDGGWDIGVLLHYILPRYRNGSGRTTRIRYDINRPVGQPSGITPREYYNR